MTSQAWVSKVQIYCISCISNGRGVFSYGRNFSEVGTQVVANAINIYLGQLECNKILKGAHILCSS